MVLETDPGAGGTSATSMPAVFLWDELFSKGGLGTPGSDLGQLTGGMAGSSNSRCNATYTWGNGNKTLIVTVGSRIGGAANPSIGAVTWTLNPTTVTGKLQSSTGEFHVCDSNSGGGNCLPSTSGGSTFRPQ